MNKANITDPQRQYDTGQISDILLMPDFLLRFATCSDPTNAATCAFTTVREGLIVALLSIGTLIGALAGAKSVLFLRSLLTLL
jgi:MFS transporter, SP family, sugar:H+ symporter